MISLRVPGTGTAIHATSSERIIDFSSSATFRLGFGSRLEGGVVNGPPTRRIRDLCGSMILFTPCIPAPTGGASHLCRGLTVRPVLRHLRRLSCIMRKEAIPSAISVQRGQSEKSFIARKAPELSGKLESALVLGAR